MKKFLSIAVIAGLMTACNDTTTTKDATTTDTSAMSATPAPAAPDTAAAMSSAAPAMKDSLMTFKDGKVMISMAGQWEPLKATFTCTNGRKVSPDGEVAKNGKKRKLTEGMMIDKDGQMMDKDGKMLDTTGWE